MNYSKIWKCFPFRKCWWWEINLIKHLDMIFFFAESMYSYQAANWSRKAKKSSWKLWTQAHRHGEMDDIITRLKWSAGRHTRLQPGHYHFSYHFPNGSPVGTTLSSTQSQGKGHNKRKNRKCMYIEVYTEGNIFNLQPFTGIITLAKEECDPPIGWCPSLENQQFSTRECHSCTLQDGGPSHRFGRLSASMSSLETSAFSRASSCLAYCPSLPPVRIVKCFLRSADT